MPILLLYFNDKCSTTKDHAQHMHCAGKRSWVLRLQLLFPLSCNYPNMDAHRKFQQNLAQGVRAGHINISDQTHGRAVYGSAAEEAMREKEQIERSLEQQKLKGQIHIPTNDTEVKNRLRILHEPICYFGEDAAARRSRLHEIIASKMSKGEKLPEFRRENEEINIQINQLLSKMQQSHKNKQTKKTIPATSTTASTSTSNKSKMKTNKTKEVLSPSKIAKFDNTGSLVTIAQKQVDLTLSNEKKEDTAGGTNATTATATTTTTTTTTTASAAAGIGSTTKTVTKKKHSKPKKKKKGKTKVTSSMVHTGHTFRSQVGTPPGMISSARRDILHFSMKNAGERVGKQRKRRENPLPPAIIREQRANTIKKLQNYSCQSSVIGGERPLTVIRVSPPILPPSSSSSSSSKQKNQENSDYPCTNGDEKKTDNNNNESNIIKVEPIHATDDMVDISYDRYLIGIGSKGGEITLWNEDGVEQARWQGHSDHITGFAWDPYNFMLDTSKNVTNCGVLKENLRFLTSSIDQTIGLWDVNGKLYHRFDTRSNFNNTVYSDKDINRMDHKERLNRIAWHPMGRHFISTSHDRSWMFWDIVQQVPLYIQKGHSAGVYSVDCQCDGSLLATGDMGGIIRLWDLRSGRCIMSFDQHIEGVLDLSFSFNGYLLASASQILVVKSGIYEK